MLKSVRNTLVVSIATLAIAALAGAAEAQTRGGGSSRTTGGGSEAGRVLTYGTQFNCPTGYDCNTRRLTTPQCDNWQERTDKRGRTIRWCRVQ